MTTSEVSHLWPSLRAEAQLPNYTAGTEQATKLLAASSVNKHLAVLLARWEGDLEQRWQLLSPRWLPLALPLRRLHLCCRRWCSCGDLANSWLASSCQPWNPSRTPQDPGMLTQPLWCLGLQLQPICSACHASPQLNRMNFLHGHTLHKLHGNMFSTNKFWGPVFTCRELLQPYNTIPFCWTTSRENWSSTPRFKMIAATDTISCLSFQDWENKP